MWSTRIKASTRGSAPAVVKICSFRESTFLKLRFVTLDSSNDEAHVSCVFFSPEKHSPSSQKRKKRPVSPTLTHLNFVDLEKSTPRLDADSKRPSRFFLYRVHVRISRFAKETAFFEASRLPLDRSSPSRRAFENHLCGRFVSLFLRQVRERPSRRLQGRRPTI